MAHSRTAGVLLHVSSIPSPYGVGVFGEECLRFLNQLAEMEFRCWQVLPFNITDQAHSPYCSPSAFAGNYLFIDPRGLCKMGLLTQAEVAENESPASPYTADYSFAEERRMASLRLAFSRLNEQQKNEIAQFAATQPWLADFALFMAVKREEKGKPWWEWEAQHAQYDLCKAQMEAFANEMDFWRFTQYLFYTQWAAVKQYAREREIGIIGDMPIYVAMDSVDVWSRPGLFQINQKTHTPSAVAGVPPDYFSADGQLWGNPLYNWDAMEEDGFRWWISRIAHALTTFDTLRIDHFRAFASYWAVPADALSAKTGRWETGPGMKLFRALEQALGAPRIIAEDLGLFGEEVVSLLNQTGFPGMRVIQFGFDPGSNSSHLPHNYPANSVAYVGTHDNNTILGWLWDAGEEERRFALDYCSFTGDNWGEGGYRSPSCRTIIEAVWRSASHTAIIAVQDMCGFGKDARMNRPGVPEQNWRYRATGDTLAQIDQEYFKKINRLYRRVDPFF